jgi:DNA-binding GntR family transcriptional regulator
MSELIQQSVPYSVQAADILRAHILDGHYQPGERLNEVSLSTSLGVSRSPIREALRTLEEEGLVQVTSGRGAFVTKLDLPEVNDLLELRRVLDPFGARLAAERGTSAEAHEVREQLDEPTDSAVSAGAGGVWTGDFHIGIITMGKNRKLLAQATSVHRQLRLARFRSGSTGPRVVEAKQEHLAILDAVVAHDADQAEELMRIHLDNASGHILEVIGKGETPDE